MKKLISILCISFALLFMGGAASAQGIVVKQVAFGAVAVDSLYGVDSAYYYLGGTALGLTPATKPLSLYGVYAIQVGTVRSTTVTGTDSCHIEIEVSQDNSNWIEYTSTTPTVIGGATYVTPLTCVTTKANGIGSYAPSSLLCYPYLRIKFKHYKASCSMYPVAYVTLKAL